jgi:hypothetical protein
VCNGTTVFGIITCPLIPRVSELSPIRRKIAIGTCSLVPRVSDLSPVRRKARLALPATVSGEWHGREWRYANLSSRPPQQPSHYGNDEYCRCQSDAKQSSSLRRWRVFVFGNIVEIDSADEPVARTGLCFDKAGPLRVVAQRFPQLSHAAVDCIVVVDVNVGRPKTGSDLLSSDHLTRVLD